MYAYEKKDPYTFSFTSPDELRLYLVQNGYRIPFSCDLSPLAEKKRLRTRAGTLTLENSLTVHPMEGFDGGEDGTPSELSRRRYLRFARSGAALIWSEAISVLPEARTSDHQLMITEKNVGAYASLIAEVKKITKAPVIAQLTHSGRFSKNSRTPHPLFATRSLPFESVRPGDRDVPVVTDEYLDTLPEAYVRAAILAEKAGFDGVDIKACHGYLLSELLSAHTREGRYGGSFENRTRLLLDIVDAVREVLRPETILASRLSVSDMIDYPYGFGVTEAVPAAPDLAEPKKLIGLLMERGLTLVDMTMGSPYFNPHINRPYNKGGYVPPEPPLRGVERLIGASREIQSAFPSLTLIGTGYSYLREFAPYIAAGALHEGDAALVGFGRMAFAYDGFASDMIAGTVDKHKVCIACSKCTEIMRAGGTTGCPIRDQEVYLPIYRQYCMKQ